MKIHAQSRFDHYIAPILYTLVRRRQKTAVNGKALHDGDPLMPFCLPETQQVRVGSPTRARVATCARLLVPQGC